MRSLRIVCAGIGAVMLASAIWGWWGFGIAAAIAVVVVMMVVSNRRPAAGQGNNQQGQPAARGGRQPDRWVQVLENVGGMLSLVVFAGLAIAVIGLARECGSGVSAELARLHETFPQQTATTQQSETAPQPTSAPQPALTFAQIPGGKTIKVALKGSDATVLPAGTEVLIRAEGCGTWKYRALNKEQEQYMLQHPDFRVRWNERKDAEANFELTRQSWVEVQTERDCRVGLRIVRTGSPT